MKKIICCGLVGVIAISVILFIVFRNPEPYDKSIFDIPSLQALDWPELSYYFDTTRELMGDPNVMNFEEIFSREDALLIVFSTSFLPYLEELGGSLSYWLMGYLTDEEFLPEWEILSQHLIAPDYADHYVDPNRLLRKMRIVHDTFAEFNRLFEAAPSYEVAASFMFIAYQLLSITYSLYFS
ncbi:MAG: hypothetical protein FWC79_02580 [Oscillospiraceae bacterium]|nr:hypothetical protein [Oscillospiraceae bacterium]